MAGYTSRSAYVKFGSTELQAYHRTFSNTETMEEIDDSAGSQAWRTFLDGDKSGEFTLELVVPADNGGTIRAAVAVGTAGTLEVGPEGTAAGKERCQIYSKVVNHGRSFTRSDVTTMSVTWRYNVTTGPTWGTYSA